MSAKNREGDFGLRSLLSLRMPVYLLGIIVLALGIDLNTKTGLGVSPIIVVAYNIAQITEIKFGVMTFFYYCLLVFFQLLILRGAFPPCQILQLAMSFFTSFFIQLFDDILPVLHTPIGRGVGLAAAAVITGIGAALTVGMHYVPNPADGLAAAFGVHVLKRNFGLGKNAVDLLSIGAAFLIGIFATGHSIGIGIGTLFTMLLTGRVIALMQRPTDRIFALASGRRQDRKEESDVDRKNERMEP